MVEHSLKKLWHRFSVQSLQKKSWVRTKLWQTAECCYWLIPNLIIASLTSNFTPKCMEYARTSITVFGTVFCCTYWKQLAEIVPDFCVSISGIRHFIMYPLANTCSNAVVNVLKQPPWILLRFIIYQQG